MLAVQPRRWLSRPKGLLIFAFTAATLYWLMLHGSGHYGGIIRQGAGGGSANAPGEPGSEGQQSATDDPNYVLSFEDKMREAQEEQQEALRQQFRLEHEQLGHELGADAIYGKTLDTLQPSKPRSREFEAQLTAGDEKTYFTTHTPYVYNPYPQKRDGKPVPYVPCKGPGGKVVSDIKVFKGLPKDFPEPLIGSYDVLGIDGDLCFERETRLGMYGFRNANDTSDSSVKWDKVRWGELQEKCFQQNKARFDLQGRPNPFVTTVYSHKKTTPFVGAESDYDLEDTPKSRDRNDDLRRGFTSVKKTPASDSLSDDSKKKEPRTAILLRTYTGKEYNENDKQVIRSLITELSLRTGGVYQVFLFVHVKDVAYPIWEDEATYQYVLQRSVPDEFRDIAVLWNDEATQAMYPKIDADKATVHVAQWLSVQKFIQEFPEFDYVWNWEMDARVTGHHYDILEKLSSFAKQQPRRGLWERSERYYIPSVHGDYDTDFREEVEKRAGKDTIWGPLDFPFINPIGPKPPVARPEDDDYKWGVGEEADLITLAPIINVNYSGWVGANDVWGFNDSSHATQQLPRRVTIVTHSRISKRLLDIMHVENLRGNHIASEMTCQTVALLHGLKAVYAPIPMFFDRPWSGKDIARWFNSGKKGDSGGDNSAIGWGREARYGGSTWYYRANPPQRLYNNFMGYEDTKIGGVEWEEIHGRPCLPPAVMHPIKDVAPTESGYQSESRLPFG